jgi:hypothetical protein
VPFSLSVAVFLGLLVADFSDVRLTPDTLLNLIWILPLVSSTVGVGRNLYRIYRAGDRARAERNFFAANLMVACGWGFLTYMIWRHFPE